MTVLYESERATVHLADARDVLPAFPKESVGLIVTDPPYGIEWQSRQRTETFDTLLGDGASKADRDGIREVLVECVRVVGQNRHLYVFGPTDVLDGLKVGRATPLIWDKGTHGGGDVTGAWAPAHEPITFAVSKYRHGGEAGADSVPARLRKGSIIRATRPTGRKVRHPSEKPVALLTELVESSSRADDTVLDPFGGIGSTAVAAILRGRKAITIELDENYAREAVRRVQVAERIADQAAAV